MDLETVVWDSIVNFMSISFWLGIKNLSSISGEVINQVVKNRYDAKTVLVWKPQLLEYESHVHYHIYR